MTAELTRPRRGPPAVTSAALVLREGAALLLQLPLWIWWATWNGGSLPTEWLPGVAALAAVAVVLAWTIPPVRPRGARAVALAALAALGLLCAVSIAWADDGGAAWTGADRMLLLLAALALPLVWPPSRRALLAATAAFPAVALAGGLAGLAGALARPESLADGRLVAPTGYPNASAALFVAGAIPAIVLASRRERRPLVRVAMLACAGPLLALALLTESRGLVVAGALTLAAMFVAVSARFRLAAAVAVVAVPVVAAAPTLLAVRPGVHAGHAGSALDDAAIAIAALAAGQVALAAVYVALDRRWTPPGLLVRRASLATRTLAAVAVVAGVCAFVAVEGSPFSWASARWHDFKTPQYIQLDRAGNRFGGNLGSNRYDYWRVATAIAAAHPAGGVGVDNFGHAYLVRRRMMKAPLYAHSLWFEALADLGVPGLALFVAFVGALAAALVAAWRAALQPDRAVVAAASAPALYVLLHGSADWLHPFAAVTVPALALAAAACAAGPPAGARTRAGTVPIAAGLALIAVAAALPVFLSARLVDHALAVDRIDPAAAYSSLESAADVEPLDARPLVQEGIIAVELGDRARARRAFVRAARRDRSNWFPWLELAVLDRSNRELAEARRRNPRDPILARVTRQLRAGQAVDPRAVALAVAREGG